MDRGPTSHLLSWLLFAAGVAVAISALGLPLQPYTGLALQGERVAFVTPGSPADQAGIRSGDLLRKPEASSMAARARGALADAEPGKPIRLERVREGETRSIRLIPTPLPETERRLSAGLLAVACGFLLLGGWVWSERRDRLTRTFLLLCLAFAWLLTPLPPGRWPGLSLAWEVVLAGTSVFLPALFIHFFALFPESRQARGRLGLSVATAYLLAATLFAASMITLLLQLGGYAAGQGALLILQAAGGLWFAGGVLLALVLFARSFVRTRSADARRRLRIALVGTVIGVAPLAALMLVRNLSPATEFPGDRWAVVLTLLVPASFAWAIAVHRLFDFRVALRSAAVVLVLSAAGVLAYFGSEWLAASWWPELGASMAGGSLAFIALAAALAGPAAPWLRGAGDEPREAPFPSPGRTPAPAALPAARLLERACASLVESYGLDTCTALVAGVSGPEVIACHGRLRSAPPARLFDMRLPDRGTASIDDIAAATVERAWLEAEEVRWLLPVGAAPRRALLLLGSRLSGTWFSLREARDVDRFAAHLDVALENAALRQEASSRGALDRELEEAGKIQSTFLPRRLPMYATLDCAAAALACQSVGGDYYDFVEVPERAFTLAVGDARGHGVPAALTLAGVQARFRTEAHRNHRPGALLKALNQELVQLDHPENFVGLLCARFEARSATLSFANAGLTPPLLRRRDGTFQELTEAGVLLGVSERAVYPDTTVQLGQGDVALVYTDGVTEARRGDEMFGVERVRAVLDRHAHRRARDLLHALLGAVRSWADQPLDDITIVVLKQLTQAPRADARLRARARKPREEPLPAVGAGWSQG